MDRRRFLASSAQALAAGWMLRGRDGWGADPLPAADGAKSPGFPDLVVAKGGPKEAIPKALEALGGLPRFLQPGQIVVIKPNASFESPPEWGATTHPETLSALIAICLEAEARRVLVVDHTMGVAERCFRRTGLADAVAAFPKAKLVSLDDRAGYQEVAVPAGKALHTVELPAVIRKADLLINLPAAKSHAATGVSLGLKNLMGLVWDRHCFHNDMDIHQGIADLATVLKPQLTILDAGRILKTGGPSGPGDVEVRGLVVAGVDPVAVDAYGVGLSTWNQQTYRADQVGYIRYAAEHNLGTAKLETLRILELA